MTLWIDLHGDGSVWEYTQEEVEGTFRILRKPIKTGGRWKHKTYLITDHDEHLQSVEQSSIIEESLGPMMGHVQEWAEEILRDRKQNEKRESTHD